MNLKFDDAGTKTFGEISQRLYGADPPLNQFAFVLDGYVLSAPSMNAIILGGDPSITGSFTQDSSKVLADQLKYGALPLSFEVVSSDTISATLGSQQLQIGLIAGLIGLALVAIYVLIVYRALGLVIIASLIVMGVLTYITICILAWRMGFRLSLAGVAGLIVSIGFTADSFIVYFERIRDELRDGKSITGAVEDGWDRAKRTIYISKSINILAAVVLYILADATVKGFAFTLGLTTVIDVMIFILFTHPVMQLLARTKFFGSGHPLSGMDPTALGAVYRGRAQFRAPVARRPPRRRPNAARRAHAVRPNVGRRSPSASRRSFRRCPTPANRPRPTRRESSDALHEPARQRPLHRQDLVPLRGASPPVVHHRGDPRDRLRARTAVPPDPVLDRVHRRVAVHRVGRLDSRPAGRHRRRPDASCRTPPPRSRRSATARSACRPTS